MSSTIDTLLKNCGLPLRNGNPVDETGRKRFFLPAGQLYATAEPTDIVTVIGSCVAVCLYDKAKGVGGANHFMLPGSSLTPSPRYAVNAFDLLLAQLLSLGARRSRLEAKLFGGASMLKIGTDAMRDLGSRNIEAARRKLEEERLPVVSEDVGGSSGRKLVFSTGDGAALLRQV
ncbi:MAG TPA: chemotaxis protein CheD [Thermoanaerobaculia bacterium]|nr:chemotaxis protein CheD [Thermoanaerobaculia bacterium]